MMWRRCLMIGMGFVFGVMLLTASTWALEGEEFVPCEQADLEGTWKVRMGAVDELMKHTGWDILKLRISATGRITKGKYYDNSIKVVSRELDIIGGRLSLSSDCVIEGYIETSRGTSYVGYGEIVEDELVLGLEEVFGAAEITEVRHTSKE